MSWEYGADYGVLTAPGTHGYFGVSIDGFVVPKGSKSVENGLRWAYMVSDPEVQAAFSVAKRSISRSKLLREVFCPAGLKGLYQTIWN